MDEALRRLISGMYDDINALMAVRDRYSADEWQREFRRIVVERHLAAYFAGSGLASLSDRAEQELGAVILQQLDYLKEFAAQLDNLSEAAAVTRALRYAGALKSTYSRGKFFLWPLPFQPGEGTECQVNDRCVWRLDIIDEEELDADAYWQLSGAEHCPTCLARNSDNPYRIRGGVLI